MSAGEVFVVMLVAVYIGWIAVAAVRSNRRAGTTGTRGSQAEPVNIADGAVVEARSRVESNRG